MVTCTSGGVNNNFKQTLFNKKHIRENEGRFLAGGFEPKAKPAYMEDELPEKRAGMLTNHNSELIMNQPITIQLSIQPINLFYY